jgi:hypothetical protein
MKENGMSIEQVVNAVDIAIHKLPYMETLYGQANVQAEKMQHTIQRLVNDIRAFDYKISILDKTALSSEQYCKRTEQRVQEITAQKDRLEKVIAKNILNGEGDSMIKQIVKENVKAVISEKKEIISASFAAAIQTLKADPQMINLIYNTGTANNGEQLKGDNNNAIKYLESNKNMLSDLPEKNYQSLVEAITNDSINTTPSTSLP